MDDVTTPAAPAAAPSDVPASVAEHEHPAPAPMPAAPPAPPAPPAPEPAPALVLAPVFTAPPAAAPASAPDQPTPPPAVVARPARDTTEFPVTVDEFLLRHSRGDQRVELLSAFRADEARSGRGRALSAEHAARLAAFAARPVS